jgi:hypothetical protein
MVVWEPLTGLLGSNSGQERASFCGKLPCSPHRPVLARPHGGRARAIGACGLASAQGAMTKFKTVGLSYAALRKECLEAVRQWPGCETVSGIQIIRNNTPGGFLVRVTLYGNADERISDRAMTCVQREKRRHFHLTE